MNGERIAAASPRIVERGDTLRFGDRCVCGLVDDSAPSPSAVSEDGRRCWGERDVLLIPNEHCPEAGIYFSGGEWRLDVSGTVSNVHSGQAIRVPSGTWKLELEQSYATPSEGSTTRELSRDLDDVELELQVSADEETVTLTLVEGGVRKQLGARSTNYLLLTLARLRQRDGEEAEAGWVDADVLAGMLKESIEKINVDVHRLRRTFCKAGVLNAARIVERRRRQLRIGTSRFRVQGG